MSRSPDMLPIPRFALVVLMGAAGSGKSTFCRRWFPDSAVISSDRCRWMVADDERAEWASAEAFALLETWVTARLKLGKLTVVDTVALEPGFRTRMLDLAREFHAPAILLALEQPGQSRRGHPQTRSTAEGAQRQMQRFHKAISRAKIEGWNRILILKDGDIERIKVEIRPLRVDCAIAPPYDLIGDIHGCFLELTMLLEQLGYRPDEQAGYRHPKGRRIIFVGDLVDRGPASLKVLALVRKMHGTGWALMTPGNHDDKLLRYLTGGRVRLDHGLEVTVAELDALEDGLRPQLVTELVTWLRSLPPYLSLDDGKLIVAHAGLPEHLQGRLSRSVAAWALYGEIRGRRLPTEAQERMPEWPLTYQGRALVVYGHTPSAEARARGNTICIDQGCVFGGKLTAYRYPEGQLVQVQASQTYYPDDAPDLEGQSERKAGDASVNRSTVGGIPPENSVTHTSDQATPASPQPLNTSLNPSGATPRVDLEEKVPPQTTQESENGSSPIGPREETNDLRTSPLFKGSQGGSLVESTGLQGSDGAVNSPTDPQAPPSSRGGDLRGMDSIRITAMPDLLPLMEGKGLPTHWMDTIPVRAQQVGEALDALHKVGVDPRWLLYIPPTIAPSATSARPEVLEHPSEIFKYYRDTGMAMVVEEMKPGSRAVVIVGRDEEAIEASFGLRQIGMIYTRLAQAYSDKAWVHTALEQLQKALEETGAFQRLGARVLAFEASILPLCRRHAEYLVRNAAPTGAALLASRHRALAALRLAAERGALGAEALIPPAERDGEGAEQMQRVIEVRGKVDLGEQALQVAPFSVLASDHRAYMDMDRMWHFKEIERWCSGSNLFVPPCWRPLRNGNDERTILRLWEQISERSGIGVMARSMAWLPRHGQRPELPGMKVRTKDCLRMVFGPQYLDPDHLKRLKQRPLRSTRTASLREWALASEGLRLFAAGEGFARFHPYALAVLASQQRPVDPRL